MCQLVGLVDLSMATVSKHLTVLRSAGLVDCRKEGRWVYYRLAEVRPGSAEADGVAMVRRIAEGSRAFAEDRARMDAICGLEPSEVARRLKSGEALCPPSCC